MLMNDISKGLVWLFDILIYWTLVLRLSWIYSSRAILFIIRQKCLVLFSYNNRCSYSKDNPSFIKNLWCYCELINSINLTTKNYFFNFRINLLEKKHV